MRLVCPNCAAQYEIENSVLPDSGRDVQCSNCGHAWFQRPAETDGDHDEAAQARPRQAETLPDLEPDPALDPELQQEIIPDLSAEFEPDIDDDAADDLDAEEDVVSDVQDAPEPESEADTFSRVLAEVDADTDSEAAPEGETGTDAEPEAASGTADDDVDAAEDPEVAQDQQPDDENPDGAPETDLAIAAMIETQKGFLGQIPDAKRHELDDDVREVLREEADHELQARAHDRELIETQTDMDLAPDEEAGAKRPSIRERVAKLRGTEEEDTEIAGDDNARREMLPDIDEINSSLEAVSQEDEYDELDPEVRERKGFRRGFMIMILLALIVVALYIYAPVLAAKWPALEPVASSFVAAIDNLRGWVDGLMQQAIMKMQQLADTS